MGLVIEAFLLKDRISEQRYDEIINAADRCHVDFPDFDPEAAAKACMKDKKNGGGGISLMLPDFENTREVRLSYEEIFRGISLWKLSR